MTLTDQAREVRNGEALDAGRILDFLLEHVPELSGEITIGQFPGGYSNLTYLIQVGDQALVLRRPPIGTKAATAHDMHREFRILKAVRPVFPYCPEPLVHCDDLSIMGSEFYVMKRIEGIILRRQMPDGLSFSPDQATRLGQNLLDVHLALHQIDIDRACLGQLGKPEGYVRRQVEGWSRRYRNAKTSDAPDCESIMAWIAEKMPPDTDRPTLIHNDFRLDNVVLDPKNPMDIIGVLDWEMATIGDPLMDLGNSLAYWVQADDPEEFQLMHMMPADMQGAMTRKELIQRYKEKSDRPMDQMDFYFCFGLFRLAVIAQQIYYRYYHGQTKDERFAMLIFGVHALEKAARRVIETGWI
ncbi:MAG: phosphotransferase [Desulfobacterales bacterium]|nr:phosphotransferase [Desulfobacterales bacterium]